MHRSTAKAYTKRAQFVGAVLVAAAGAVVLVKATPPEAIKIEAPEAPKNNETAERAVKRREIADAAAGLSSKLDAIAPPVPKAEPKIATLQPTEPPKPPPPPPLKYIGAIMTGSFKRAIVVVTGTDMKEQQKMLAEGDAVEKQTVLAIAPDYITVRDDKGDEKTIELAQRQLRALRIVGPSGPSNPSGGMGPIVMQPNGDGGKGGISPEVAAMENKITEMQKGGDADGAAKLQAEVDRMRSGEKARGGGGGGKGGK
ncbi:MAG: hypothetical protein ACREJO_10920 [Phycisphaerales bacterium]